MGSSSYPSQVGGSAADVLLDGWRAAAGGGGQQRQRTRAGRRHRWVTAVARVGWWCVSPNSKVAVVVVERMAAAHVCLAWAGSMECASVAVHVQPLGWPLQRQGLWRGPAADACTCNTPSGSTLRSRRRLCTTDWWNSTTPMGGVPETWRSGRGTRDFTQNPATLLPAPSYPVSICLSPTNLKLQKAPLQS